MSGRNLFLLLRAAISIVEVVIFDRPGILDGCHRHPLRWKPLTFLLPALIRASRSLFRFATSAGPAKP
jgi:hypothetical protein